MKVFYALVFWDDVKNFRVSDVLFIAVRLLLIARSLAGNSHMIIYHFIMCKLIFLAFKQLYQVLKR